MTGWLFEALMLLAFGVSWPASISKSLRTRFVRGKSPAFMMIVISGYACGIVHKLLNPPADADFLAKYVLWLYVMDLLLVSTDLTLYFLFRKNEAPRGA
jgi:hypothetical protein